MSLFFLHCSHELELVTGNSSLYLLDCGKTNRSEGAQPSLQNILPIVPFLTETYGFPHGYIIAQLLIAYMNRQRFFVDAVEGGYKRVLARAWA